MDGSPTNYDAQVARDMKPPSSVVDEWSYDEKQVLDRIKDPEVAKRYVETVELWSDRLVEALSVLLKGKSFMEAGISYDEPGSYILEGRKGTMYEHPLSDQESAPIWHVAFRKPEMPGYAEVKPEEESRNLDFCVKLRALKKLKTLLAGELAETEQKTGKALFSYADTLKEKLGPGKFLVAPTLEKAHYTATIQETDGSQRDALILQTLITDEGKRGNTSRLYEVTNYQIEKLEIAFPSFWRQEAWRKTDPEFDPDSSLFIRLRFEPTGNCIDERPGEYTFGDKTVSYPSTSISKEAKAVYPVIQSRTGGMKHDYIAMQTNRTTIDASQLRPPVL